MQPINFCFSHFKGILLQKNCCDQRAPVISTQSFTLWQKATRDHVPSSLYFCLFAPHIHCCYS